MKTKVSLGIFWTFEPPSGGEKYQDELAGLIFYGYWSSDAPELVQKCVNTFIAIWGKVNVATKLRKWEGEGNCNYSIDVNIKSWPNEHHWRFCIGNSLRWFTDQGAAIAWCGSELCSPTLAIFNPGDSRGSVYAAYSPDIGFFCNSGLYDEYRGLETNQLIEIKALL